MVILFSLIYGSFSKKTTGEQLQAVYNQIQLLNTDLSCQSSSDCFVQPTGARTCGGPNGYLILSHLNKQVTTIIQLAKQTETLEQQYNQQTHIISICSIAIPPTVSCTNQQCVKSTQGLFQPVLPV
ncbi:unnamed protein product [Didymodactylos carnosus]|uniref:Uncharacterized protein n=1 Tax=Didymodactylos carnosus TaxID=1234261 RepID=A0A8S2CWX3_9BILA|nr:unnamed protein product [Didymodactylos carnosus]CAF3563607.1 unnamed protein product [Didymodactylos carnosus]